MSKFKRGQQVTVTAEEFKATSRSSGVMYYIGWDSAQMVAVRSALDEYERKRDENARKMLAMAVRAWHAEQPHEFSNRNTLSKGVAQRLYDEVVLPELGHPIDAIVMHGVDNPLADRRSTPRVTATDTSIVGLMDKLLTKHKRVGIIVIDIYGKSLKDVGLDSRYGGDTTVEANIQAMLDYVGPAERTYRVEIPVINFTMKLEQTMQGIASHLPASTEHLVKPSNNIFESTKVDELLAGKGVTHWIVTGFDANFCVAASIFGTPGSKVVRLEKRRNQYGIMDDYPVHDWCRGLLDRGYSVVTSRRILCSTGAELKSQDGWPWLGPSNR